MAILVPNAHFIARRRRALAVLARNPDGCTQADMYARGFSRAVLGHLVLPGLATSHVEARAKPVRLKITERGRLAIRRRARGE
jgi:hypothetical protein